MSNDFGDMPIKKYVHQEYPKTMYHQTKCMHKIVNSAEEEAALGEEFGCKPPAPAVEELEGAPFPTEPPAEVRRRGRAKQE